MIQFAVIILPTAAVYTAVVGLVAGAGARRSSLAGLVAGTAATAAFELTVLVVDQLIGYHIVGTEGQKGHAAYRHSWTGTHGLPGRRSRAVAVPARP